LTKLLEASKFAHGPKSRKRRRNEKNLEAYLRLNKTRYKDLYVVLVDGKPVAKGKAIDKILRNVRKSYPRKVPFVAKVPGDEVLVL
jgi:hypothetical protein